MSVNVLINFPKETIFFTKRENDNFSAYNYIKCKKLYVKKGRSVVGSRKVRDQAKSSGSDRIRICNTGLWLRKFINPSFCHVQWVLVKIFDDDRKARDPRR